MFNINPKWISRGSNLTDVAVLGSASIIGALGNAAGGISLVALYMTFQIIDYTIAEWRDG